MEYVNAIWYMKHYLCMSPGEIAELVRRSNNQIRLYEQGMSSIPPRVQKTIMRRVDDAISDLEGPEWRIRHVLEAREYIAFNAALVPRPPSENVRRAMEWLKENLPARAERVRDLAPCSPTIMADAARRLGVQKYTQRRVKWWAFPKPSRAPARESHSRERVQDTRVRLDFRRTGS